MYKAQFGYKVWLAWIIESSDRAVKVAQPCSTKISDITAGVKLSFLVKALGTVLKAEYFIHESHRVDGELEACSQKQLRRLGFYNITFWTVQTMLQAKTDCIVFKMIGDNWTKFYQQ